MKPLSIYIIGLLCLSGCASMGTTPAQMEKLSANLKYPIQPNNDEVLTASSKIIKRKLKSPDSLKNLKVISTEKCTFAKQNLRGNITPINASGQWCYQMSYQATNSYGGYVRGDEFIVYTTEVGYELLDPNKGLIVSENLNFRYDASNPFLLPPGKQ